MGVIVYKKYISIVIIFTLFFSFYGYAVAEHQDGLFYNLETDLIVTQNEGTNYGVQWLKNYGPGDEGGRFEGPQPIGDCDNNGKNEINAGSVIVEDNEDFMSWVFKYGWEEKR